VSLVPNGFAKKKGGPKVRISGRLKIAQRFIAGIRGKPEMQSVKRTAERVEGLTVSFSRPLYGLQTLQHFYPSSELLGYYQSSALRTETYFLSKATPN
jgi:hypothetical protein